VLAFEAGRASVMLVSAGHWTSCGCHSAWNPTSNNYIRFGESRLNNAIEIDKAFESKSDVAYIT